MINILRVNNEKILDFFHDSLGVINKYLVDSDVTDIMLNPDGKLWLDTFSNGQMATGDIISWEQAEQIIRIAGTIKGKYFDDKNPSVATELIHEGARFQGVMPPQSAAPMFTIRKKPKKIFDLHDYLNQGAINNKQYQLINKAVKNRDNILIAGGTGSGKTTFANAILKEIAKLKTRIAILEDTVELQCSAENSYNFKATDNVNMQKLLKDTLRMNIDSIVVGEVRGAEALDLLKAWNTGHPGGVATVHSDSAEDALFRMEQLIQEGSRHNQRHLISRAINVVVFLGRNAERQRVVKQILRVQGLVEMCNPYQVVNF